MMKKWMLAGLALLSFAAAANEKLVFACDFSNGFKPQKSVQPLDIFAKDAKVVDSDGGKALLFGKAPDRKNRRRRPAVPAAVRTHGIQIPGCRLETG